ncbi:MAG: hypothetical protein HQL48_06530 [Gammaproteobacteria bacterium]|nr:hypothetical protein [Gammaproteobacteria bacterium]
MDHRTGLLYQNMAGLEEELQRLNRLLESKQYIEDSDPVNDTVTPQAYEGPTVH